MTKITYISAKELQNLYQQSDVVIYDIREADEYAREHIIGAYNTPISKFEQYHFTNLDDKIVVFHCQSGMRTQMNEEKLQQVKCKQIFILKNGLSEWNSLGYATAINNKAPLPIMRQVQIVAGSLILLGIIAGFLITPILFLLSGVVGAGLIFAGLTGFCGMANLLMLLPYNKRNKCKQSCV